MVKDNNLYSLLVVEVLEIILLALKWAHLGTFWALKWVLGNYFNFGSFDMFNIAYYDYFE